MAGGCGADIMALLLERGRRLTPLTPRDRSRSVADRGGRANPGGLEQQFLFNRGESS